MSSPIIQFNERVKLIDEISKFTILKTYLFLKNIDIITIIVKD
jgi:hypothetical protein